MHRRARRLARYWSADVSRDALGPDAIAVTNPAVDFQVLDEASKIQLQGVALERPI